MVEALNQELQAYGALPQQIVTISPDSARALRYADLLRGDDDWRPPVVVEHEHVPRVFVFDGRDEVDQSVINGWYRRVLLRGDPAWTAILRPGRLEVRAFDIKDRTITPREAGEIARDSGGLAKFIHSVRSGATDLPRRRYLYDLLTRSMEDAIVQGVPNSRDAISVVGLGLFWRFLVDRGLLAGIEPGQIAQDASNWTDCLSSKQSALQTLAWLEKTFNGGLFKFDVSPEHFPEAVFQCVLGDIAAGATATGQLHLPQFWSEIDFSHIPVGLLSEVYEAFAHRMAPEEAKKRSIFYTPRHIAEFVVAETLATVSERQPRVLDPSAGAGVFLVAAFRQLVQHEWERTGIRPDRETIRRILSTQLTGFDIDAQALYLARLALYLTALELETGPSPGELHQLKFSSLDHALVCRPSEQDGSLAAVDENFRGRFDVVIGNPPWTAKKGKDKKRWIRNIGDDVRRRLPATDLTPEIPDANPDIAFFWRTAEWARPGGHVALVIDARRLFGLSDSSFRTRRQLFSVFNVTGILNGAALRRTNVWPNISAPFCVVFARNEVAPRDGLFHFVSPFVERQNKNEQTVLRIDWGDAELVSHDEVRTFPWALKSRFRADPMARCAFESLRRIGIPLKDYLRTLGTELRDGYVKGKGSRERKPATALQGMRHFSRVKGEVFAVRKSDLGAFDHTLEFQYPRRRDTYLGPLLVLRESVIADRLRPRSVRVDCDAVFSESFHGISFANVERSEDQARLLQLLMQSAVVEFFLLLVDRSFGSERERTEMASFQSVPVVPLERLSEAQLRDMRRLSKAMEGGLDHDLLREIDLFVFDLFGLLNVERDAVMDTLEVRGPRPTSDKTAVRHTDADDRREFLKVLRSSLDDVLQASGLRSSVTELGARGLPWRVLSVATRDVPSPELDIGVLLKTADESGTSLVIVPTSNWHVFVALPDLYRYWTRTQARLLAAELVGGPLGNV